jgi:CRP/FNR family transcriptional regulator, cyclic AMP receptor protein
MAPPQSGLRIRVFSLLPELRFGHSTYRETTTSIYKLGEASKHAYVMMSGGVQVTTVDHDHQEVLVDESRDSEFFGFAPMLEDTPHQTTALAMEETTCVEVAGVDMLTVVSRQFHA